MNTTTVQNSRNQLWGIYHTDREHARELDDPLRTTVEAPTKIAAEKKLLPNSASVIHGHIRSHQKLLGWRSGYLKGNRDIGKSATTNLHEASEFNNDHATTHIHPNTHRH